MALFKIFKGLKANLPKTYNDGYCYVTTDDGKMYIDTTNDSSGRICLNAGQADTATNVAWSGVTGKPSTYPPDSHTHDYLPLAGGQMSGSLDMNNNIIWNLARPVAGDQAANKQYVDDAAAQKLHKAGDSMEGDLNMNGHVLWGLSNPTGYDQPVTYRMHVDDLAGKLSTSGGTMTGTLKVSGNNQGGVEIRSDNEGGNIIIDSGNDHNNYWEIDSFNGDLRMYTYRESDSTLQYNTLHQDDGYWDNAHYATSSGNSDTVDGYHATNFGINKNAGDADLNTCTQSGFYRLGGTITNGYSNASWSQMLVVHGAGDTICQVGMPYNERALYIRQGNPTDVGGAGSWQEWKRLWGAGDAVTGAVWNDYAECRESDCYEAGYVLSENGDDTLSKSNERLAPFAGVSSDTWGFSQGETEKAKTHIAVAGRVLVYPYQDRNNYKPGDCVCAAPEGTVDIMTEEEIIKYPHRIVGTVSCVPDYETWGGGESADRDPVEVNGRIWIKVR